MKHNVKVTAILLGMFLISQIIGLMVINAYSPEQVEVVNASTGQIENITVSPEIPYGMQPPETKPEEGIIMLFSAIIIATILILILRRINAIVLIRIWFFSVIAVSIAISLYGFLGNIFRQNLQIVDLNLSLLAVVLALPLTFYKVFERNIIVHNLTELLIYPGIAVVFIPILNIYTAIILLIAIALYDVYAVWHAKFMQKLAKFQIQKLGVFTGFYLPYVARKDRVKLGRIRSIAKKQGSKEAEKLLKKMKIKVNLAILGGGDITFPMIFSGVLLRSMGLPAALVVTAASTLSLLLLFILAKKGKFYPAMLFLSPACILGYFIALLF